MSPPRQASFPPPHPDHARKERALLVQLNVGRYSKAEAADSLSELEGLADTAGVDVIGHVTQHRDRPTARLLIGKGKLVDIQLACRQGHANLVIFDNELSAVQVNNLDLALGIKVIDRTELILQIFARRAKSSEAQIQVELAQLEYLVSRIPVSHKQQRFQGGIGMRGPGESPLQLRNAPMRRRIKDLRRKLRKIRDRRRRTRTRRPWPLVCLVGYTNVGKSTLMNAMATADAHVDDRLFATLDTKTRLVRAGNGVEFLLTDTVGFIRNLPHGLVASFRSTLEEVTQADLLLVVADAGHPRLDDHLQIVDDTLAEIDAQDVPAMLVLNKCDTPGAREQAAAVRSAHPEAVPISARRKEGLDVLKERIARALHSGNTDR